MLKIFINESLQGRCAIKLSIGPKIRGIGVANANEDGTVNVTGTVNFPNFLNADRLRPLP